MTIFSFHDVSDIDRQLLAASVPSPQFIQYLGRRIKELKEQQLNISESDEKKFHIEYIKRQLRREVVEDLQRFVVELANQANHQSGKVE